MKDKMSYPEIYKLIQDLRIEMNGRFDKLDVSFSEKIERTNGRVSGLEKWQSNMMGKIAVIASFFVIIVNMIGNWIYDKIIRGQ